MTLTFTSLDADWWPYVFILLAGALPTAIWRWMGVFLVGNLDEKSEIIILARCISTALIAAVVAQFIFAPSEALATVPLWVRLGAAVSGFLLFLLSKRLFVGVATGEALLIAGAFAAG